MNLEGENQESQEQAVKPQRVVVTDIDIDFGELVGFLVKLSLAAIPAAIIVLIVVWMAAMIFGSMIK